MPTLVVVDELPSRALLTRVRGRALLVAFTGRRDAVERVQVALARMADSVDIVDARPLLRLVADRTRDAYIKFVADWPLRAFCGPRSFRDRFVRRGLSLWWLTELRMKDVERSPSFRLLVRAELVRDLLVRHGCDRCVVLTLDPYLADLARQVSARLRVSCEVIGPVRHPAARDSLLWLLASRGRFLTRVLAGMALARLWPPPPAGRREVGFFTFLGDSLRWQDGRLQDRHYVDLPEFLERNTDRQPLFCTPLYAHLSYVLRSRAGAAASGSVLPLERYVHFGEVVGAIFDLDAVRGYLSCERSAAFVESTRFGEFDLGALIRQELRRSFIGPQIAECLILLAAFERLGARRPMTDLISYHEMYPISFAAYHGAKRGNPRLRTIAYQHAVVTPMKLWYCSDPSEMPVNGSRPPGVAAMPIPDIFLCAGTLGYRVLRDGGFPESRLVLTGTPRYDGLASALALRAENVRATLDIAIPPGSRVILVTTSYGKQDAAALIDAAAQACSGRAEWFVVFKPHPARPIRGIVVTAAARAGLSAWAISHRSVHELLAVCDVLVTTYSTTADEAVALGRPVVTFQPSLDISLGTFWVINAAPEARDAGELRAQLQVLLERPEELAPYRRHWPELVEATFHRLDGRAKERILKALFADARD